MKRAAIVSAFTLTGCLIVPAQQTSRQSLGSELATARLGPIQRVTLAAEVDHDALVVRARASRTCRRDILDVTEVTRTRKLRFYGVDDPRGRVFGALLAPVLLPVSAVVSGVIVIVTADETTQQRKLQRVQTLACTTPGANLAIELAFGSGVTYKRTTDADGVLRFAIPKDEPYAGTVQVTAAAAAARQIAYDIAKPPISVARDAVDACRRQYEVGAVTLKLAINDRGHPTRLWVDAGDAQFNACLGTHLAGTLFPEIFRGRTIVMPFPS